MKIVHYSLGFPPYRSGGLTKFCMDLMKEQVRTGNDVSLMWPGEIGLQNKKTRIRKGPKVCGIHNYEIVNPLPVPYDEGVGDPKVFLDCGDESVYASFFEDEKPDILHIHTFMGLHKNMIVAARSAGVRVVFTAHDFFPICPKVTMFRNGKICDCIRDCSACAECNQTALPYWKMVLLQSGLYRKLKETEFVKKLRKNHRDAYLGDDSGSDQNDRSSVASATDYCTLRTQFCSMLDLTDCIHYNSSLTKQVYEAYVGKHTNVVIPVTHGDIKDNRIVKQFNADRLRITYLGPKSVGKGWYLLKSALDELWGKRKDFLLSVFFQSDDKPEYVIEHGRYDHSMLERIFLETDVLVAPSIWYETFGFTVLEALSFGVPVIVSENVGAKEMILQGSGIVTEASAESLRKAVDSLTESKLCKMNKEIIEHSTIQTINEMNRILTDSCYRKGAV